MYDEVKRLCNVILLSIRHTSDLSCINTDNEVLRIILKRNSYMGTIVLNTADNWHLPDWWQTLKDLKSQKTILWAIPRHTTLNVGLVNDQWTSESEVSKTDVQLIMDLFRIRWSRLVPICTWITSAMSLQTFL